MRQPTLQTTAPLDPDPHRPGVSNWMVQQAGKWDSRIGSLRNTCDLRRRLDGPNHGVNRALASPAPPCYVDVVFRDDVNCRTV